eukprot:g39507.t1
MISGGFHIQLSGRAGYRTLTEARYAPELPPLPYSYDALQPVISERQLRIHHTKHHQGYAKKLNDALESMVQAGHKALAKTGIDSILKNIDQIPLQWREPIINHGGGFVNHDLFWKVMRAPQEDNKPVGKIAEKIEAQFGSFAKFQEAFSSTAVKHFGSGWCWLLFKPKDQALYVMSMGNQESPTSQGLVPLLTLDIWEHAYYLDYENRRDEFVAGWWSLVNWDFVNELYTAALAMHSKEL